MSKISFYGVRAQTCAAFRFGVRPRDRRVWGAARLRLILPRATIFRVQGSSWSRRERADADDGCL